MTRKIKRTVKKNNGLEARIAREKFLKELKTPTTKQENSAEAILQKIRQRRGPSPNKMGKPGSNPYKKSGPKPNAYDAGPDGAMGKMLRKLTGTR